MEMNFSKRFAGSFIWNEHKIHHKLGAQDNILNNRASKIINSLLLMLGTANHEDAQKNLVVLVSFCFTLPSLPPTLGGLIAKLTSSLAPLLRNLVPANSLDLRAISVTYMGRP